MQVRKWLIAGLMVTFLASCGDAETKSETTTDTTNLNDNGVAMGAAEGNQRRPAEPSVAVRTSFEAKYPQAANVSWNYHEPTVITPIEWEWSDWRIDTSDYYASFTVNEEDYWVWYDQDGNWIGTVSEVKDHASLPAAVNKAVREQFSGYTIQSVDKENDKDRVAYEIELTKGDDKMTALIAENGKVMKKKGKVNDVKIKEKNNPKDSI